LVEARRCPLPPTSSSRVICLVPKGRSGVVRAVDRLRFVATFVYKVRVEGIFACPASGYGSNA